MERKENCVCAVTFRFRSLSLFFSFFIIVHFIFLMETFSLWYFTTFAWTQAKRRGRNIQRGDWYGYCVTMLGLVLLSFFVCLSYSGQPTWWNHNEAQKYNRIWVCVCVCGNGMFRWVRRVERKTGTPNEIFRAVREINRKGNHNSVPYIECNNPYACSHGLFSFKMLLNVLSRFKKYFYYFCARCPFVHFKGIWVFLWSDAFRERVKITIFFICYFKK